jgi:hypothetical protein
LKILKIKLREKQQFAIFCMSLRQLVKEEVTGWAAQELGFTSRQGQEVFLFSRASISGLGASRPPNGHWG